MFHIIYKTTNLINGKIYIGAHSTSVLNDGYLGSGKYLKRAIKKYGIENFKREILHLFNTKEEMFSKEREIVTVDFIEENNTYNLKIGGSGGNPGIVGAFSGRKHSNETKKKIVEKRKLQSPADAATRQKMSENNGMKNSAIARKKVADALCGSKQTETHKQKVADANIGKVKINNGIIAKSVSKEIANELVNAGEWKYGLLPRNKIV